MNVFHIQDYNASSASRVVMDHLRENGGKWLLWSANDEGYLMAPVDSWRARQVFKHWQDAVVGTFDASAHVHPLAEAMRSVRRNLPNRAQELSHRLNNREYMKGYMREYRKQKVAA